MISLRRRRVRHDDALVRPTRRCLKSPKRRGLKEAALQKNSGNRENLGSSQKRDYAESVRRGAFAAAGAALLRRLVDDGGCVKDQGRRRRRRHDVPRGPDNLGARDATFAERRLDEGLELAALAHLERVSGALQFAAESFGVIARTLARRAA